MKDDGYKIRDEFGVYYLTFAVVQWVDVFSRKTYVDIVLDSLKFCIENKQLNLFAWCIMTKHRIFSLEDLQNTGYKPDKARSIPCLLESLRL